MEFDLIACDPQALDAEVARTSAALKANRGLSDLAGHGVGVVARRLQLDRLRYRDYGPMWWAVKDVLRQAGHPVGDESEPELVRLFSGATPAHTLVWAGAFRAQNLRTHAVGTSRFVVSRDGDAYDLFDPDMEHGAGA